MDTLAPEVSDLILDLVALDRSSLIQLSSVSKFFRRRLAPRIFCKLVVKNILRGESFDAIYDRLERLLGFIETSEWHVCVESINFEMRLPDLQKLKESGPDGPDHDMKALEIVSSSSIWFPERLTYILSNLSSLFPSLHTLEIYFPSTDLDCDDTFDLIISRPPEIPEDSYHHVLIKLLDLTFEAVAQNGPEENLGQAGIESQSSDDKERPFNQQIKHFSISEYPPFGCDALLTPRFRTFLSNLLSFSLEECEDYNLDEGAYFNEDLQAFLSETIPESFLSHLYTGTCLENLRLQSLSSCCFGVTESLYLEPRHMGSLKKLVLENILLSYQNTITDSSGLGAFIKNNSSTLEEIELTSAGWIAESFEQGSVDHWGSLWAFLREHRPANLRRLHVNEHFIDIDPQKPHAESPEEVYFQYEFLDMGWGYTEWDMKEEEIPASRRDEDFKQWVLLRNSILGSK